MQHVPCKEGPYNWELVYFMRTLIKFSVFMFCSHCFSRRRTFIWVSLQMATCCPRVVSTVLGHSSLRIPKKSVGVNLARRWFQGWGVFHDGFHFFRVPFRLVGYTTISRFPRYHCLEHVLCSGVTRTAPLGQAKDLSSISTKLAFSSAKGIHESR